MNETLAGQTVEMATPKLLAILVAAAVAVVVVLWLDPTVIAFKNYSAADFIQQLTPLVLVSLFIERSLEVFITVWRGGRTTELQRALDAANALAGTDSTKAEKVQSATKALDAYRSTTQQIALPSGLVLGILISSIGVRGLGNFADLAKLTNTAQRHLFGIADVLLTGAVMGGGSDFMHKVITTFTDIMDATSQKAKASAK